MSKERRDYPPQVGEPAHENARLIEALGEDLRLVITYIHGPDDGLEIVLALARRFKCTEDEVRGIILFYQQITERKTGAALHVLCPTLGDGWTVKDR